MRELVLVGGGHAHVQVLHRLAMHPIPGARVCVVLDRPESVYSGMVPGFVAGDFALPELEIDVLPLARRAGARVVLARALRVDTSARRIELEGRAPIAYDVASLDVGSSVRGMDLPGVRERALATRPIRAFVDALDARLSSARVASGGRALRVAVVGAGIAGVELAFTLRARLRQAGVPAQLCVLEAEAELLPGYAPRVRARVCARAERAGIELRTAAPVVAVEKDGVALAGGKEVPADLVVWATGAAPPGVVRDSPLPRGAGGFVRVRPTLQVEGAPALFAAGDCAALEGAPWVPRAGVYAVRQGPLLDANLRAWLAGGALRPYRPQRDFLALLNLGERRALGTKWGVTVEGRWVWRWKRRIDRRFVRRFDALARRAAMGEPMPPCGGCAAKLGASALHAALARLGPAPRDPAVLLGLERPDDAAAWRTRSGDVVLATIDGFRAFTDDPWLVGRVAAVHATSDVRAKGGDPRHALAFVQLADEDPARASETLYQVLAGMRAALDAEGISLVGGHTASGTELVVGLAILGEARAALRPLGDLLPGDRLILTRPLGTGVMLAADARGLARGRQIAATWRAMLRSNASASRVAQEHGVRACTDVSGFGLAGHLAAMLRASRVSARLELRAVPALDGALELLARGVRSSHHHQNLPLPVALRIASRLQRDARLPLLFDPQTSGGLLLGAEPSRASGLVRALRAEGDEAAAIIGEVLLDPPEEPVLEIA